MTMLEDKDTICAISTPAGVGGIAVIRVSGPDAVAVADRLWRGKPLSSAAPRSVHYGTIVDGEGRVIDDCVAAVFRAPASFTGEDVVELSVHGSVYVQKETVNALIAAGARLAERGEFTRRAFAAGKMDLAQAEGVADLIASRSRAAHDIAVRQMKGGFSRRLASLHDSLLELASLLELELDFSEEDVEFASRLKLLQQAQELRGEIERLAASFRSGNAIKEGIPVAIVGPTNVGKSSLLNALAGDDLAIVSDIHGTTRDLIEDTVNIGDYTFRFIDTAGLRDTTDTIEKLGIDRSRRAISRATILLRVIDATAPQSIDIADEIADGQHLLTVINKTDAATSAAARDLLAKETTPGQIIEVSAKTQAGIDNLREALTDTAATLIGDTGDIIVTNARHHQALTDALPPLHRVINGLETNLSGDFIAQDLREVLHHLGTITGTVTTTEILTSIFTRFCIGK
ncbi:MAG: tRNA uridine-5-carboxymethylaminomethyl(34) synthesis GTPase MnmE [Bacteroidales bacterium]|nr:tRNA uridine-5-carboxymethylaminomethyl(34) synthesis GTPase MnmE [Bacteroidales bacterium]